MDKQQYKICQCKQASVSTSTPKYCTYIHKYTSAWCPLCVRMFSGGRVWGVGENEEKLNQEEAGFTTEEHVRSPSSSAGSTPCFYFNTSTEISVFKSKTSIVNRLKVQS